MDNQNLRSQYQAHREAYAALTEPVYEAAVRTGERRKSPAFEEFKKLSREQRSHAQACRDIEEQILQDVLGELFVNEYGYPKNRRKAVEA